MIQRVLLAAVMGLAVLAAQDRPSVDVPAKDAWAKVEALKPGTEIRIARKGGRVLEAKMDEANAERIVIVTKEEQMAIPKAEVLRLEARLQPTRKVTRETRVSDSDPAKDAADAARYAGTPQGRIRTNGTGPQRSSASSLTFGGKAEYETVYQYRPAPKP